MLEVSFGKHWVPVEEQGWLLSCHIEGDYLLLTLDYRRLLTCGKAESITRARWRWNGRGYTTVLLSIGPEQRVALVKARPVSGAMY